MRYNKAHDLSHYISLATRYPILTFEQEKALARRWRDDKDPAAGQRLVLCNLRAVLKIAGEFRNQHTAFEDLVQEGHVGLLRAIDRYDPERETRILSYAGWWIRACIKEFLLRTRSQVRLGTTQKQRSIYSRLGRAKAELERKYPDCDPAHRLERLAEILDADPALVEQMEGRLSGHDLSLHTRVDDGSDTMYVDLLPDQSPDTEQLTSSAETAAFRSRCLADAMTVLGDRERFIIEQRFLAPTTQTLRELGERLGISRERVRQLEVRAKKKMHQHLVTSLPDAQELPEFVQPEPQVRVA